MTPLRNLRVLLALLSLFTATAVYAQQKTAAPAPTKAAAAPAAAAAPVAAAASPGSLSPEVLGAQAFLEELLVRRYAQELSTRVEKGNFTVGAQFELVEAPPPTAPKDEDDTPPDFLLGTIDPEAILSKYAGPEERRVMAAFLNNYRIKVVTLSVGLKETVGAETKSQVDTWLAARLKSEFGAAGKGSTYFVRDNGKSALDWLNQFQGLAGQVVLALAVLLGLLLWKGGSAGADAGKGGAVDGAVTVTHKKDKEGEEGEHAAGQDGDKGPAEDYNPTPAMREIQQLGRRIGDLLPKLGDNLEPLIKTWCVSGEEGKLKLACFAEAVGHGLGRLPIPVDTIPDVSKVFATMPEMGVREKRDTLRKAYWDLLKAVNLGSDTLEEPFGYLGSLNVDLLGQVLMDQNSKMKTLVAFHMPSNLRQSYLKSMDTDAKREMIQQAAELTEIAANELKSSDGLIKGRLNAGGNRDVVKLPSTLEKVVSALTPIEEATLLSSMEGSAFDGFKRQRPSLAFLSQWPEEKLQRLFSEAMPPEVVALIRVREDLKDLVIKACPTMTARIAEDELAQPDKLKDPEKNQLLAQLAARIKSLVDSKELDLEEIFSNPQDGGGSGDAAA